VPDQKLLTINGCIVDELLTRIELQDLTGYASKKRIINWLKANRIPFMISGSGLPRVNRQALAYLMGAPVAEEPKKSIELNFDHEGFSP
jgi:hypothetical protein